MRYPYIYAYGRMIGYAPAYVERLVAMAMEDEAPGDAWSYKGVRRVRVDDAPRRWLTVRELDEGSDVDRRTASKLRAYTGFVES
jgi:hypothetical protein